MTAVAIAMALVCQLFLVAGQLLLKRAMGVPPVRVPWLIAAIASLAVWFFVWMSLLANWPLSRVYPFEGLNPALIVAGSAIVLRERVTATAWIGVLMISAGVAIIAL